ncbi:hypothetical protein [Kitasatospora sp. NPDC059827]|uniref:hypothetical protein n=1 Tax=Kitasatospora sp. NPDC059827 TaxID=3346964 RepID=UPI00364DCDAD
MTWSDFEVDTGLERDILERGLPLAPTQGDGTSGASIVMATRSWHIALAMADGTSGTPQDCISLLRIRPLLFGTAWKVLDLLFEEALRQAHVRPRQNGRFSISSKEQQARQAAAGPAFVPADIWQAAMLCYADTVELRHSLVHRNAYTDTSESLIGHDASGQTLRPLAPAEQEAFVRMALRMAETVISQQQNPRKEADLRGQLSTLSALHGMVFAPAAAIERVPEIRAAVSPETNGDYLLDVPYLRANTPFPAAHYIDLIITFSDRPGQALRGQLEEAPNQIATIDPRQPPSWLQ